ncbi:MAG: oxidoreductase [Rhodospirillaceae bacterium]|nr:oxidoreductase [Rhodospirillaceae bacterium]
MLTRREWLRNITLAAASITYPLKFLNTQEIPLITRAIPSSGERLPVIGLGGAATFGRLARNGDLETLREVMRTLLANGGTVFDTAEAYGPSEIIAGQLAQELGIEEQLFWSTKVNSAKPEWGPSYPDVTRQQIQDSFDRINKMPIDLMQIHNLGDIKTQLPMIQELKDQGRVRYIGITYDTPDRNDELIQAMREETLDFIGIDYAVDNTAAAETILPLAQDRGIATIIYQPFGRTRLWSRVAGRDVPEWAQEFNAKSWAQFFIKYVIAHPAVTVVTPATSKPDNLIDNMAGGIGELPDSSTLKRMEDFVAALPPAG